VRGISIGGLGIPAFWTGVLRILFLVIAVEGIPPLVFVPLWENPWENFKPLVWQPPGRFVFCRVLWYIVAASQPVEFGLRPLITGVPAYRRWPRRQVPTSYLSS
jgi:hypothetical protein